MGARHARACPRPLSCVPLLLPNSFFLSDDSKTYPVRFEGDACDSHLFLIMTSLPNPTSFLLPRSSLMDVPTDRKVQTIKNLEKPWAALAAPEQDRASASSIASSRSTSPEPTTSFTHSAATTILLDDSHAKAALQPYNHVCLREYTRSQRNADLTILGLNLGPPSTPPPPAPPRNDSPTGRGGAPRGEGK
jgi:hypothetical protein